MELPDPAVDTDRSLDCIGRQSAAVRDFWWGLVVPVRVPPDIVKRLNSELNEILSQAKMRDLLAREAAVPTPGSIEDFGKLIVADIARWNKLVKERNIQTE